MARKPDEVVQSGRWKIGLHKPSGMTLLKFEFPTRDLVIVGLRADEAEKLAKEILDQLRNPPRTRKRMH